MKFVTLHSVVDDIRRPTRELLGCYTLSYHLTALTVAHVNRCDDGMMENFREFPAAGCCVSRARARDRSVRALTVSSRRRVEFRGQAK